MQIDFNKQQNTFPTFTPIKIQYFPFSSGNRVLDIHTSWGKWNFRISIHWKTKSKLYGN